MPTGITLTDTINYSGMLHARTDKATKFIDAIYARGREGGRRTTNSVEFILAGGYKTRDPKQPEISEEQSLTAPDPKTTERDQESNVIQIYHESVAVSYMKQSNFNALGGVNVAGAANNTPNELDFQVGVVVDEMRKDLNWTTINGTYQYIPGSTTVAPKSRGLMEALQTNRFDIGGAYLSKNVVNDVLMNSIKNGFSPEGIEIWVNPDMMDIITDTYIQIPGSALPSSRTEGGVAYSTILTNYGDINIFWDTMIPTACISFINVSLLAIAEKPTINDRGENLGVLFYEPLAKTGASERGQLYGEIGFDYGAEWHHSIMTGIGR